MTMSCKDGRQQRLAALHGDHRRNDQGLWGVTVFLDLWIFIMKKRLFTQLSTLLLACTALPGAALAQAPTPGGMEELAHYAGPDRMQRLVEGAKKEGSLVWYNAFTSENVKQLIEPFEKKYGIKVNVWRARAELTLQRFIYEARADKPVADIITSSAAEVLHRENLLQEIVSPYQKELIPSAVPAHREWAAVLQFVLVQAYNTNKVNKDELPKTYQDLLAPKWKGKLGIEGTDHVWVTSVINDMGEANGTRFFDDLTAGNKLSVRLGHPLMTNLVASGEVPLALTVYQYSVEEAKKSGAPIDWFVIDSAVATFGAMAIPKKAPHPHAAILFYDYMISAEGQSIIAKIGYPTTNLKVKSPIGNVKLKFLDPGSLIDGEEKSNTRFESILRNNKN